MVPFMFSAIFLFASGAYLGYHFVFPGMLKFLIVKLSGDLGIHPIISIEEYTSFFFSLILGMAQLLSCGGDLLSGDVWDCEPEVSLEEHALCDLDHLHHRGDHYAFAGYSDAVCVCGADAAAVSAEYWRGMVGASEPKRKKKRRRAVRLGYHVDGSASEVSHPCRDKTAPRMGHPLFWAWMLLILPAAGLLSSIFGATRRWRLPSSLWPSGRAGA